MEYTAIEDHREERGFCYNERKINACRGAQTPTGPTPTEEAQLLSNSTTNDQVIEGRRGRFWMEDDVLDHYAKDLGVYGLAVYTVLCRRAGKNGDSHPSVRRIAEDLDISESQAKRELKKLKKLGLIDVTPRSNDKQHFTSIYRVLEVPRSKVDIGGGGSSVNGGGGSSVTPKGIHSKEGINTPTVCANGRTKQQDLTDQFLNQLRDRYNVRLKREQYSFHLGQFSEMLEKDEPTEEELDRVIAHMVERWPQHQKMNAVEALQDVRVGRDTGEAWAGPAPWEKAQQDRKSASPLPAHEQWKEGYYRNFRDFTGGRTY